MLITYEESVLDHCDQEGNLSYADACQLLQEHGFELADIYADNHDIDPVALDARNGRALLSWLGY